MSEPRIWTLYEHPKHYAEWTIRGPLPEWGTEVEVVEKSVYDQAVKIIYEYVYGGIGRWLEPDVEPMVAFLAAQPDFTPIPDWDGTTEPF